MKPVGVVLLPEAEEAYRQLNSMASDSKEERSILNSINKKVELIRAKPHYGNPIARNMIPKEYIAKYGVTNLFRVEVSNFWRMQGSDVANLLYSEVQMRYKVGRPQISDYSTQHSLSFVGS